MHEVKREELVLSELCPSISFGERFLFKICQANVVERSICGYIGGNCLSFPPLTRPTFLQQGLKFGLDFCGAVLNGAVKFLLYLEVTFLTNMGIL